ncbi:Xaa-Pro aminopeptidase [hydrothermal vent metagenome]|uniref:Xaa-Pro aminopeptidase n=1 Tax=hydrothermal vent metagenome TaxID=652676 RepID=A0A3B1D4U2_9ZZZZ
MPAQDETLKIDKNSNVLMVAGSETDANIYYASHFLAPDPFIYLQTKGTSYLLMNDLELDRARAQSDVAQVLPYSKYEAQAKSSGIESPRLSDVLSLFMLEQSVSQWIVPANFSLRLGDALRKQGHTLLTKDEPFFETRALKTETEVEAMREAQIAVEDALDSTLDLLRCAEIKDGLLVLEGETLTSQSVRRHLDLALMEKDCIAQHTIVSCGVDACDPHNEGSGPLRAHESIIFDIFPRSNKTRYHADMTRTVLKGKAPDALKRLYDTVLEGQLLGVSQVKKGVNGREIHQNIMHCFEKKGYKTGLIDGRMQGFFHGTGHGIGLDIHEPPRISKADHVLQTGEVVTVEPGLYYPNIGAVRIEDMVLVEDTACRNLTTYPKFLELD